MWCFFFVVFFFKQKTAYEMRISDWSSDVCSSDLGVDRRFIICRQRMKIERTCHHQFSKAACVALLLSRKTAGTQRIELTCQQFAGRAALAKQRFQFAPDRCGGLHAHLLPDNGAEQRSEERRVGKECGSTCRYRG